MSIFYTNKKPYEMVFIYVLLLKDNKYYVGKTINPDFRIEKHFNSSGSAWTKKYSPIKLLELISDCDDFDEDKYTKIYMNKYGIDNVRGGTFCQIELDKETKEILTKMISSAMDKCYSCGEVGHFVDSCPYQSELFFKADVLSWINSIKTIEPLFILKSYLKEIAKVNWFSINYEDRYSSDKIKKEKWNLFVINVRKDILNSKTININSTVEKLTIIRYEQENEFNKISNKLAKKKDKADYNLKITNSLIGELHKLKVMSITSFFDYFTDLLLIDID